MAVRHKGNGSVGFDVDVPYLGSVEVQFQAAADFYVYCMDTACDVRMFDDFKVDACVVFTKPAEFKDRLQRAIAAELPDWKYIAGPVVYFDPYFSPVHQIVPHFWKHFQFSYQREFRFAWLPPTPDFSIKGALAHIQFDVGPLTDCGKLVWL